MQHSAKALVAGLRATDQDGVGRVDRMESGTGSIRRLMELEQRADVVRAWDQYAIPALLQTPRYSRALIQAGNPRLHRTELDRRAMLKASRVQAWMYRNMPHSITRAYFILGEQAAVNVIGGDFETHAAQLDHLVALSKYEHIAIQILPTSEVPPELTSHFTMYGIEERMAGGVNVTNVGFMETVMGDYYSTRTDDLVRLRAACRDLMSRALGDVQSIRFVEEVLESWRSR